MTKDSGNAVGDGWQPFMPSNGTEGDMFMTDACQGCSKFDDCELILKSMFGEQPAEWEAKWNQRGIADWRCRATDAPTQGDSHE